MQNFLFKLAKNLYNKGYYKFAGEVTDLFRRTPQQKHNEQVLKDWREQKKSQEILEQHQRDGTSLQTAPYFGSELTYDTSDLKQTPPSRRFDVDLIYADVGPAGEPVFKQDSIRDSISISAEEVPLLKEEQKKGFIKILDIQPTYPDAD